ncbi:protein kinase [Streptomyces sp. NBRC 110611]|nr:protein kinase [Streptomyces sp. NBRC 110611]
MHRTFAALVLASGAMGSVSPATANATQTDRPLLFSVDYELARLNDLGPQGRVGQAATSFAPVLELFGPLSGAPQR